VYDYYADKYHAGKIGWGWSRRMENNTSSDRGTNFMVVRLILNRVNTDREELYMHGTVEHRL
jgi:hypothetical protein